MMGKKDMERLEKIERSLDEIRSILSLDDKEKSLAFRALSALAELTVRRGEKLERYKEAIKEWKKNPSYIEREIKELRDEYNLAWHYDLKKRDEILAELKRRRPQELLLMIKTAMRGLSPETRRLVSKMMAMRVFPEYVENPIDVKFVSPILFKGRMKKPPENPIYMLDRYLLEKVGRYIGKALYVIPAFSAEYEFTRFGHVLAVNTGGKYEPEKMENLTYIKKRAQDLEESEIHEIKEKTGHNKTVLVIKGINDILGKEEMKALLEKVNPDYIAVYGTYHRKGLGHLGIPRIDKETLDLVKEHGFKDITEEVFSKDELSRIESIENKIKTLFHPWAEYFPATKVRVFKRARL